MVKFRQVIKPGDKGRDVKAVKDGLKRMKAKGYQKLDTKSDKAGKSFVTCLKSVQRHHKLKADGIYGPKTHAIVAKHFSAWDKIRYRLAKIRRHPLPNSASAAAKRLLELHAQGKFHDDRGTVLGQVQAAAEGKAIRNAAGYYVHLNAKMLESLVYLIDTKGHKEIGVFALCSDHGFDSPKGHAGGFCADISTIDGVSVLSGSAKPHVLSVLHDLRTAKGLVPWQLISGGYAGHEDSDCKALCIPYSGYYGEPTLSEHCNHIHVGYE